MFQDNLNLYRHFRFASDRPLAFGGWSTWVLSDYAYAWRTLASDLKAQGDLPLSRRALQESARYGACFQSPCR